MESQYVSEVLPIKLRSSPTPLPRSSVICLTRDGATTDWVPTRQRNQDSRWSSRFLVLSFLLLSSCPPFFLSLSCGVTRAPTPSVSVRRSPEDHRRLEPTKGTGADLPPVDPILLGVGFRGAMFRLWNKTREVTGQMR